MISSKRLPLLALMLSLILILPTAAHAGERQQSRFDPAVLDAFLESQVSQHRLPGLSIVVVSADEILYEQGYRDLQPTSIVYVGSVSKPITAYAALQLAQADAIDPAEPVQTYLPWFGFTDPTLAEQVTVQDLLNHTSGLSDLGYRVNLPATASIETAARDLERADPTGTPGETFAYFNSNYQALGAVIEAASGDPYEQIIADQVFDPLGMTDSMASSTAPSQGVLTSGHSAFFAFPFQRQEPHVTYGLPSGYLISTTADLARFAQAQLGDEDWLPANVNTADLPYENGWFAADYGNVRGFEHTGDLGNYHAGIVLLPDQDLAFAYTVNLNHVLYAVMAYPTIRQGVVAAISGDEPQQGTSMSVLFTILAVVFLITVGSDVRWFISGYPRWREAAQGAPLNRMLPGLLLQLGVVILLAFGVPVFISQLTGRAVNFATIFGLSPDLGLWLAFGVLSNLGKFGLKAAFIAQQGRAEHAG
ncbi:MAG: beta-lactamase family protein [Chloroflexi bacterium]|nr:beta-lactamase family protein [Chloroflexota bacterium]